MTSKSATGVKLQNKSALPKPTRSATARSDNGSMSRSSSVSTLASEARARDVPDGLEDGSSFCIGDTVWVNGTKPGIVKYLGETQFAPGVWAGIGLEEAAGKNDGSVNGVKYFECEPQHGIFIRPHRLTREPGCPPSLTGDSPMVKERPPSRASIGRSPGTPGSSLVSPTRHVCSKLRPGERVIVSSTQGNKTGILRFLGTTEFAVGEWAGIELDLPVGKNDGSVGGKRYFTCKMKHGLFSPVSKISREGGVHNSQTPSMSGSFRNRSYSRESLNSCASSVTSTKAGRVKLGVNSLGSNQKSPGAASTIAQTALQEVLKEKEEHIEQLLKERDLDRTEVARTTNKATEVEQKLSAFQTQHESYVQESETQLMFLKERCDKIEAERKQISSMLDERNRKFEDLQFRLEEETILNGDLKSQAEKDSDRIQKLEILLKENMKSQVPAEQSLKLDSLLGEKDTQLAKLKSEVDKLTRELSSRDEQIASLMASIAEAKGRALELELDSGKRSELENRHKQLEEQLQSLCADKNNLTNEVTVLKTTIQNYEQKEKENNAEVASFKDLIQKKEEEISKLCADLEVNKTIAGSKDGLENELINLRNAKETVTKESNEKIQQLVSQIEQLTSNLKEKELSVSGSSDQIKSLQKDLDEKATELLKVQQMLTENKRNHEIEASEIASRYKLLEEKMAKLSDEKDKLQKTDAEKIQQLTSQIEQLMTDLKQKELLSSSNSDQVTTLKKCIEEKEVELLKVKQMVTESKQKYESAANESALQYKSLEEKIAQLTEEKDKLQAVQAEKEQYSALEVERLTQERKKCESEIQALTTSLENKEKDTCDLRSKLEEAEKEIVLLNQGSSEQITGLKNKISEMTNAVESLQREKEQKEQNSAQEIERLSEERKKFESEIHTLTNSLEDKEKELCDIRSKLEETKQEVALLNQGSSEQISELQNKISESRNVIENLKLEKEQKEQNSAQEIERLSEEKKKFESEIHALTNSFKDKEKELYDIQSKLEETKQEVALLNQGSSEQISGLQNKISELRNVIENLKLEKEQKEQNSAQKLEHLSQERKKCESEIQVLTTSLEIKEKELCDLQSKLEEAKQEVVLLNQGSTEQISELQNKISETKNAFESLKLEKEQKEQNLAEEVERLSQERTKFGSEIQTLTTSVESKEKELHDLRTKLEEAKKEIALLSQGSSEQISGLQNKISEMTNVVENLTLEKEQVGKRAKEEMEQLTAQLNEKTRLLSEKEQIMENLNQIIQEKEKIVSDLNATLSINENKFNEIQNQLAQKENLLQGQVTELQTSSHAAVKEKEESIKSLEAKISGLISSMQGKEQETQQKQKEIQALKHAVDEKEGQIIELGQLVEKSQLQLEQLKMQNNNNLVLLESRIAEFKKQQDKLVGEKEKKLQEEIERLNSELQKKAKDVECRNSEINSLSLKTKALEEEVQKLQLAQKESESEKQTKLTQEVARKEELERQLQLTKSQCDKLKLENEEATKQVKHAQEARQELEKSKDSLLNDKMEQLALIKDREAKLELLQKEVERMQLEFFQHKEELQQKLDVSQMELEAMKDFKTQLELQHEVLEELQQQLQESENKCAQMKHQQQEQQIISGEKRQLETKIKELQDMLNSTVVKLTSETEVNQILRKQLDGNEVLLKIKNEELEKMKLATPKNVPAEIDNLKVQVTKLKDENSSLSTELTKLKQKAVGDNQNIGDSTDAAWIEEKEGLLSQVNFLNSIIVDMQKKNEELKKQLESNDEEKDVNFNGFKAPRFFCDICDMFDLHDTEDCPKQCSIEDEDDEPCAPRSKHNGKRNEERPYCNNCEIFGHWTLDCDQEETF